MTNPPQPGQEGYGQSAAEGDGGAPNNGGAANQWAENPPGAAGPGAHVPPPDQPVVVYPTAHYPPQPEQPLAAYPTAYNPPQPEQPLAAYPTAHYPPQPEQAYPTAYYPPPSGANYAPQGYGYGVPYGYLGHYPQGQATDGMAIASLVVSCAAVLSLCAWGIGGLLLGTMGAIFGHVARGRVRNSGAGGGGLALAGIIVGWVAAVLGLIGLGLLITIIVLDETGTNF